MGGKQIPGSPVSWNIGHGKVNTKEAAYRHGVGRCLEAIGIWADAIYLSGDDIRMAKFKADIISIFDRYQEQE